MVDTSQSYYPRARCRVVVRFEEFADKVFTGKVPKKPTKNLKGVKDQRAPLELKDDPESPNGVKRKVLVPKSSTPSSGGPQDQEASSDNLTHAIAGIIPLEARLTKNGLRMADQLHVKFRFIDFPIDPRIVRSVGVVFYLGTITPADAAAAVTTGSGMIPDTYVDENGDTRTNKHFQGFTDKIHVEWPENGEPYVEMTLRDNTSILIDEDAPAGLVVDAKLGIDEAIGNYLTHFPRFAGLSIEYRGLEGDTPPKLEAVLAKTAFRPTLGPSLAKGGGAEGSDKLSVWDYLTDVCGMIGHTIRLENNAIIVQKARTYMSIAPSKASRPDDPFKGRGDWQVRRWIYGRNVKSMSMERNYTRTAPTNIEVRCYSPRRKKVLVGRFPSTGDTIADSKPGAVSADEKWKVIEVDGIDDENALRIIAQSYYEQIGRNELEVRLTTHNLASFGGGNLDPDVLDMMAGDAFEILVNRDEEEEFNTFTKMEKALTVVERSVAFMRSLGYPESFADAYAKAYVNAGFQTVFKCRSIEITWSITELVAIEIVGCNYLEVRADKLLGGS